MRMKKQYFPKREVVGHEKDLLIYFGPKKCSRYGCSNPAHFIEYDHFNVNGIKSLACYLLCTECAADLCYIRN